MPESGTSIVRLLVPAAVKRCVTPAFIAPDGPWRRVAGTKDHTIEAAPAYCVVACASSGEVADRAAAVDCTVAWLIVWSFVQPTWP